MAKSASPSMVRQEPPEERCWTFTERMSRSAWLEVNPTARSVVNRKIMSRWSRNRRASRSTSFAGSTELVRSPGRPGESCPGCRTGYGENWNRFDPGRDRCQAGINESCQRKSAGLLGDLALMRVSMGSPPLHGELDMCASADDEGAY
jgi:hypothetical protein